MDANQTIYDRDEVVRIISSVLSKVAKSETLSRKQLYEEIRSLHDIIEAMRTDLGSVRPGEISGKDIPTATDELDAVVEATARATGTIMDSCEAIEKIADELDPEIKDKLADQVTRIYESCSFQDITGQRITKVVKTLKTIDEKVESILSTVGFKEMEDESQETKSVEQGDAALMNGPQMPDQAVSQDDIDKLLAEFD